VEAEQNIVLPCLSAQRLSVFPLYLRFLSPPHRLVLESVKSFFPQKAGDIS
jgi:hypothetical protein